MPLCGFGLVSDDLVSVFACTGAARKRGLDFTKEADNKKMAEWSYHGPAMRSENSRMFAT